MVNTDITQMKYQMSKTILSPPPPNQVTIWTGMNV